MNKNKHFGQYIKEIRLKDTNYSLRQFAKILRKEDGTSISPSYLSDIENARRNPPSPFIIKQMAGILNVNEDKLLNIAKKTSPEITEYLRDNPPVLRLLRRAMESDFDDWEKIEKLIADETEE